jgi:hypothetical protein
MMNTWSHSNTYWVMSSISHIWPGLVTLSTNSHLAMMQCSVHIHIGLRCNAHVLLLVSYKSWCWGEGTPSRAPCLMFGLFGPSQPLRCRTNPLRRRFPRVLFFQAFTGEMAEARVMLDGRTRSWRRPGGPSMGSVMSGRFLQRFSKKY